MNEAIIKMLARYPEKSREAQEQAIREIIQEIALVGLWRGKFFEHAAFYGGTALRILYGLDRFSEDLDFTLLKPEPNFSWLKYESALIQEISSYGFQVSLVEKEKGHGSPIKSAFLKANTLRELLRVGVHTKGISDLHPDTLIRVKIEIDTDPIVFFQTDQKILSDPAPVSIRCVNLEGLFAGKMHAALFRGWKGRVKGRDWYDLIWYIRRNTPLNLGIFSIFLGKEKPISKEEFLDIARTKIYSLNIQSAIADILPFVKDQEAIQREWSASWFLQWLDRITYSP